MRFVWAVVAFVLAAVLIGAGIAQRTIFMGPDSASAQVEIDEAAPFVLIDGDVLREHPGSQTLLIRGDGEIFASYGRTADMKAWLAASDYNDVTVDDDGEISVEHVPVADGTEAVVHNPIGSDLWLDSFSDTDLLITDNLQLPEGTSMLVAYDGAAAAPDDIRITWPIDNSTPLAGPLMVLGGIVLLVGLVLYVLGIRHQRRGRGPRRKGPGPLPVTEPIDLAEIPEADRAAIAPQPDADPQPEQPDSAPAGDDKQTTMRAHRVPRRRLLALPALGLIGVLAAGCTADSWPQFDPSSPSPSPTPTVIVPENQKPAAVTEAQATRILQNISQTLSDADAALDLDTAKTRLDGAALAARTTEYTLRGKLTDRALPAVIPTDKVEVVLPEATDRWPRTVLLLSKSTSDDTVPPVVLTMTQQDPWSDYKVTNLAEMSADAVFPDVAAPYLGTSLVPADSAFLSIAPEKLAETFSDVVDNGEKSESYGLFDDLSHTLVKAVQDSRQTVVQKLADNNASETSKAEFDMVPTDAAPVSMTTLGSGAVVAISVQDVQTVTPTAEGAVIRFGDENPEAKALIGGSEAAKGVKTVYQLQLFFSVPAQGSTEQIHLLGVHQDLLSIEAIK